MSLNEKQVLKQAKEQPEEFIAWTPDDIINQPLKEAVMAAVLRARPSATVEGVMDLLNDMRVNMYKEKIRELTPRVPVLGKPFI
ncbi:hypothetical protein J3459_011973 [Metarhizium acridum]|nr:hypothetical protein J3459_011973 [Metarhizium acridum]